MVDAADSAPAGPPRSERLPGEPGVVLAAVGRAAEDWGGQWERGGSGGRLELPVAAGLRHGWMRARLDVRSLPPEEGEARTEAVLTPEAASYRLWTPAVVVLLIALGGGALTVLWPFFPRLLPAAPIGAILALSAWFLVIARLQNRGPEEFLALVAAHAEELAFGPGEEPDVE